VKLRSGDEAYEYNRWICGVSCGHARQFELWQLNTKSILASKLSRILERLAPLVVV